MASAGGAHSALHAPQLVHNSQTLYLVWRAADPAAAAALVPEGLTPAAAGTCYINQYVVPGADQTSNSADPEDGWGPYSLTYLGVELDGLDTEAGVPGRWWTHYYNSSEPMQRYAAERGVPAEGGRTELEVEPTSVTATTFVDDRPVIRTVARIDDSDGGRATGQLRYITQGDDGFVSGRYPYVADLAGGFEVQSFEFLDADHPVSALRAEGPEAITFGFYSPAMTFCYPGGEGPVGSFHGG